MSKRQKLIDKILSGQLVSFDDVVTIMAFLQFKVRVVGSHHSFYKPGHHTVTIPKQKPLKPIYIQKVKEVLKHHGYEL